MTCTHIHRTMPAIFLLCLTSSPFNVLAAEGEDEEAAEAPEIAIGERLFLETRFAQYFFARANGNANHELDQGDPVVENTQTTGEPLPGPFAGASMNCRACHMVDEHLETLGGGMRTDADFARRSPVPLRDEDTLVTTPRTSPALANASVPRDGGLLVWTPRPGPLRSVHAQRLLRHNRRCASFLY